MGLGKEPDMHRPAMLMALALSGCVGDETLRTYGAADRDWHLQSIDGSGFTARAIVRFPDRGVISGEGPCNSFSGKQEAPYPWFEVKAIAATKRACPDLSQEAAFFAALRFMTLAEVSGDVMILSTPDGREMVFEAKER